MRNWVVRAARGAVRRLTGDFRYISELQVELNAARQTIAEMSFVVSPPEKDGYFEAAGVRFYRSSFNTAWLAEFGIDPRCIVDVGSYDAGDAVRFKRAYPQARVIAFEADPSRASIVKARAAEFGVEAVEAAAFSRDGDLSWYQATVNGGIGSQGSAFRHTEELNKKFPHVRQHTHPITVRATRLGTYCKDQGVEEIDLLHVDAQGSEHDVVAGLGTLRPSLVYVELDDGVAGWVDAKGRSAIHALMSGLGYVVAADCGSDRLYVHGPLILKGK